MVNHEDQLLKLIGDIHMGASSEREWVRALDGISDALGYSSIFMGGDGAVQSERFIVGHRIDEECAALIGGPLATPEANPFLAAMPATSVGTPVSTSAMCGDEILLRSPLYQQGLRPFGQRYVLGALLERIEGRSTVFAITRRAVAGDYSEADAGLLAILLPHLARANHLRAEFGLIRQSAAAALALLESVRRGVLLLDARGHIVFANGEAERIVALNDGLLAGREGLSAHDGQARSRLRALIANAANISVRSRPGGAMVLPRPSGRRPFTVNVMPAPIAPAVGLAPHSSPVVAVFVVDPHCEAPPRIDRLRAIYGLSRAEAVLATRLYAGDDLGEAAVTLGISLNTAKTQLKAVFAKVGVNRQSMLVRRIALDLGGLA